MELAGKAKFFLQGGGMGYLISRKIKTQIMQNGISGFIFVIRSPAGGGK
jgi:hypothetical protein